MGIVIVGSLNYDLVTYTDRVPEEGETIKANLFETHVGGKGFNQAIGISRLMPKYEESCIKMIGSVGDDSFGKDLIEMLSQNRVESSNIKVVPDIKTGTATILVEKQSGQNRILIAAGANSYSEYSDAQLERIFTDYNDNDRTFVVLQNEIPGTLDIMHWLRENRPHSEVFYNPSPFLSLSQEQWRMVDVLVVNEIEALQVVESAFGVSYGNELKTLISENFVEGYKTIALELQKKLINPCNLSSVVITLGEKGCVYISKLEETPGFVEAIRVPRVIDTTGAGDTFLGGIVSQLYQGIELKDAVKFSTIASSLSIQRNGAADSIPTYAEIVI